MPIDELGKIAVVIFVGFMLLATFWLCFLMLLGVTCTSQIGPYISVCQQPANRPQSGEAP